MLPGTNHARIIARSGLDWICVDTEHGNIAGKILGYIYMLYVGRKPWWFVKRQCEEHILYDHVLVSVLCAFGTQPILQAT